MTPKLRVPFGLATDVLVEPGQVKNGKLCGCICPGCKRPLIAKQGAATPHFAHAPGEDCANGLETAVHLAAKQIIAERKQVRLPAVEYLNPYTSGRGLSLVSDEAVVSIDDVRLEPWLDDMRPDILVVIDGKEFLVEIAVTNFVDAHKLSKIHRLKMPSIEIDASSLKGNFTFESLSQLLFSAPYPATWLYNETIDRSTEEASASHITSLATEQSEKLAAATKRSEAYRRYKNLPPELKLKRNINSVGLSPHQMEKFSIFVPWSNSFGAPTIVWQSGVLAYIANEELQPGWGNYLPCNIQANSCLNWLRCVFDVNPQVKDGDSIALWGYLSNAVKLIRL